MIETIEFAGRRYPAFQASGNAARFVLPFALEVCRGRGLDIGCGRPEWAFPGAMPCDPALNEWDAHNLPPGLWDFVFSSHCLEHIPDWVGALDHWGSKLRTGGVLFLYLPHGGPEGNVYWRPYHNRKHLHILRPHDIAGYLEARGYRDVFVGGCDLNCSFAAMGVRA